MNWFKEKKQIIVHSGTFHADEVCAVAILQLAFPEVSFKVTRTRDESKFSEADFLIDVGRVYDPEKNLFDHHQGGAGIRNNGIPYASCGLIWKHVGQRLTKDAAVFDRVDEVFIAPIDALDNGMDLVKEYTTDTRVFSWSTAIATFVPVWSEDAQKTDAQFMKAVAITRAVLERVLINAKAAISAEERVDAVYEASNDKQIIILPDDMPSDALIKYPEPIYAIYPDNGLWHIKAIRKNNQSFETRKPFPVAWAGLSDEKLQQITNESDAVFCHLKQFLLVTKTQETALRLAKRALLA